MGYCTVDDIRDEGFKACDFLDRRVQRAIDDAASFIERITGRFFEPRSLTFVRTWAGQPDLLMELPLIAVDEMRFVHLDNTLSSPFDATDFVTYNRHVREGLVDPDDRENPKIAFLFVRPNLIVPRTDPAVLQEFILNRVQNVQVKGVFGYTQPLFTGARVIATNVGDAITAPNTIKMVNGAFSVAGGDLGRKITVANSASTNNGAKTISQVVSSDTVKVTEVLVTEGAGFTASLATFPQWGVTPREIRRACMLLAIRNLPARGTADPIETALAGGRIRSMATRDQSISFAVDQRAESGLGGITGDPELDSLIVPFMRPPKFGAA